jgi:anthranilate synthase component II
MILIIDNYDSFTYNLYQMLGAYIPEMIVIRNDQTTIEEIEKMQISHIIISPGPGFPKDAGISIALIKHFAGKIPILGVCLGHQAICEAFGGKVIHAKEMFHGKSSLVTVNDSKLFLDLPEKITVGRYHSLIVEKESLPHDLEVTALSSTDEIMSVKHKIHPVYGIQFHPESILTEFGSTMIRNFLEV